MTACLLENTAAGVNSYATQDNDCAGSTSGKQLRLRGQGSRTSPPGDLYLKLEVVPPPSGAITVEARKVLQNLGDETKVRTAPGWPR